MNKILRPKNLPSVVLILGIIAAGLRMWTIGGGPDAAGLYPRQSVAWNLLWLLTVLTLGVCVVCLRCLRTPGEYRENYPASPISAFGAGLAAVAAALTVPVLFAEKDNTFAVIAGCVGVLAAVGMAYVAYCRFKGVKPSFAAHFAMCLYMAMRMFNCCRSWSNEPQLGVFVFPLVTMICAMLAAFQLACMDAGIGKRRTCAVWCLMGMYCAMATLPSGEDVWFNGCVALWLLTNLPSLRLLKQPPVEEVPAEEPVLEQESSDPL